MNYFPCIKCKAILSLKGKELLFPLKKTMFKLWLYPLHGVTCRSTWSPAARWPGWPRPLTDVIDPGHVSAHTAPRRRSSGNSKNLILMSFKYVVCYVHSYLSQ